MTKTYHTLTNYMHENHSNTFQAGRQTGYSIQDVIGEGVHLLLSGEGEIEEGQEEESLVVVGEADVAGDM
jgi:hypothetical protein